MSWLYSQALVEEYLHQNCLATESCALLRSTPTAQAYYYKDKTTYQSLHFQFGTMFEHLTDFHGVGVLTWYLEVSHARHLVLLHQGKTMQTIFGRKCGESWQMSLPGTSLPKTSVKTPSTTRQTTSRRWVTKSDAPSYQRKTWVQTTFGKDSGYLHTPTCTANYAAPSMQKWASCREFVRVFGIPTPKNQEWMMGWPIGWTDLKPLETGKFLSWLQKHGNY